MYYYQIIAAQEEMLRKERELEEARKKLAHIRQQQYKFLPSELREDQSWTRLLPLDAISALDRDRWWWLAVLTWRLIWCDLNVIGSRQYGTSTSDWPRGCLCVNGLSVT